ncbi:MAG: tetratricopeptide repeat protein [Deltaproteobacteria bacterium]|nr:tetratricopeptide repeat protein [Deltaproteobacteria bacterium]
MKAFFVLSQPRRALRCPTSTSILARFYGALCGALIGFVALGGLPRLDATSSWLSQGSAWAAASGKTKKSKSKRKKGKGKKGRRTKNKSSADDAAPASTSATKSEGVGDPSAPGPEARLGTATAASFRVDTILDERSISRTRQADEKRNEAIEELKKLIPRARESQKAEMIFRLAELYWEKSKYKYGLEMEAYEKAHGAWSDGGAQGAQPELKSFVRESDLIKRNALKLYEKVLTDYPDYPRNDAVLFYLGYNEYEDGEKKKAVDHYWTLVKRFPKSRLVPDAYLQLGEHFFADNDVVRARKAFDFALSTQEARVHNYALYKLAWCDYNVQEFEQGIKRLKEVIERSEEGKDRKAVQLKSEALRDLALFFSSVDEVEGAYAYFKAKGGEDIALRYMTALASLYQKQGKWPLQIESCRLLLDKYPMNEKAPEVQAQVVQAYSQLNQKDKVRQEVERLVDLYRPGTPWSESQKARGAQGQAALEYAYDVTESSLRELVTDYHRDAQKRKDVATYKLARDIYAKYLDAFSDTDYAYQMRFFFAEVLWALKEWKQAALEYGRVVRTKTEDKAPGKYARLAAYNAILAWEKMATEGEKGTLTSGMKIVESKEKGRTDARRITKLRLKALTQGETYEEQAIPEVELSLSRACDVYFKIADPKDEELPAIKFKAAYVYYSHNHFVAAAERYFEIIERWPQDALAKKSAHLIMDSLNVQEKWDELEKYARSFLDNERLAGRDQGFRKEVRELLQGAAYKAIQVAEVSARKLDDSVAKGRALGAVAKRFLKLRKEFPKSPYADKALYSAVLIYNQANQLDRAIKAAGLMASAYSDSEYSAENLLLLAGFHERIADFEGAADLYTKFFETYHVKVKRNPNPKAADALFNAGIYYEGLGDRKRAADRFSTYVREFGARADAADVYWRICDLHEQDKAWKQAAECFDAFQTRFKKADQGKIFESRYRVALNLEKQKKQPLAMKEYKWLVSEFPKLPAAAREMDGVRAAGARAAFELLEPEYENYRRMKVTLNRKSLLKKAQTADDLACVSSDDKACKTQGKFLGILTYGSGDYGIAALTRMGQVYRGMADSIRSAPIPRNLTEDQLEIYRAELDSVALGPEEKAIEAFENALAKAYELNIYNTWTSLAQENLRELNPNKFPDPQKPKFMGADGLVVLSIRGGTTRPVSGGGEG